MPAHWFVNRGGVLIKKEFLGFEKYHQNDADLTTWLKMVYPTIMNSHAEVPKGAH